MLPATTVAIVQIVPNPSPVPITYAIATNGGASEIVTAELGIVRYANESVLLDTKNMEVGRPYPYKLGMEWRLASIRADGTVDFYRFRAKK